jgi:hypothetical protein
MPNIVAATGISVARAYAHLVHSEFKPGKYILFAVLCAAASYIAVTAVQRLAIPTRAPSPPVPLAASLGLTFSYNVTIRDSGVYRDRPPRRLKGFNSANRRRPKLFSAHHDDADQAGGRTREQTPTIPETCMTASASPKCCCCGAPFDSNRSGKTPACTPRGNPARSKCPLYAASGLWSEPEDYRLSLKETLQQTERRRARWPYGRLLELLGPDMSRIS